MKTHMLPRPSQIEPEIWVDESIWGHRLYDEQTPWFCLLEMLCVLQSEAFKGSPFLETQVGDLKYQVYHRLYLRNILFNNPHIDAVIEEYSDDDERWRVWIKKMGRNPGGISSPDFEYLRSRFGTFDDFARVVNFLQVTSIEGESNKRWSSKFVFPYGSHCLYEDLRVTPNKEPSNDRRFFGRTGELLYLMISRSGKGKQIFAYLEKIGVITKGASRNPKKWDRVVLALQPNDCEATFRQSKSPPYLPYEKLPSYETLGIDYLNIFECNLPNYDALPHIVTITGLHLIIYLLSRALATLEREPAPRFILEIIAPKKTTVRSLASDQYQNNNSLPQQAIEHYINSTAELPEWQTCLNSDTPREDAIDILRDRFAWSDAEESSADSPEDLLKQLRDKAIKRHKQHLGKFHGAWSREIGLSSSRSSRRTRYAPTDSLLRTLVLACVPNRMEFQEFLATLHQKYGFVIGDRQASDLIASGEADRGDFVANAERLEYRLARIGLLKRLSDACAYVQNPFAPEKQNHASN